jgi:hypothetical protein
MDCITADDFMQLASRFDGQLQFDPFSGTYCRLVILRMRSAVWLHSSHPIEGFKLRRTIIPNLVRLARVRVQIPYTSDAWLARRWAASQVW